MVSLIDASNRLSPRGYQKPLRPVILLFASLTFIWSLVFGVKFLQDRNSPSESKRMKSFDTALAVSFFVVAVIEIFGITAAATQKIRWTRIYFILACFAGLLTSFTQLIMFIAHFVLKSDLIGECRNDLTGARAETISGTVTSIDATQAQNLCEDDWQRGTWWDLGWFVLTTTLAFLFTGLVGAYYQQLLNPPFSRPIDAESSPQNFPSNESHNNHYPLQPYHPDNMTSTHLLTQDPPFAPPQYLHPPEYPTKGDNQTSNYDNKKHGLVNVNLSSSHPA